MKNIINILKVKEVNDFKRAYYLSFVFMHLAICWFLKSEHYIISKHDRFKWASGSRKAKKDG
jgi:hypothetical protein